MSNKKLRRTGESDNAGSTTGGSGIGNSENGNSSVRTALRRILKDLLNNNGGTSIKEPISIKKFRRD
ncbi:MULTISPECIES: hypothetical protein [Peribacillus]|uniref:hypothetical protein n=1 Tax=Peribacillus frigoritolerans TaxID=450367 RepID=UPI003DA086CC